MNHHRRLIRIGDSWHTVSGLATTLLFYLVVILLPGVVGATFAFGIASLGLVAQIVGGLFASCLMAGALLLVAYLAGRDR